MRNKIAPLFTLSFILTACGNPHLESEESKKLLSAMTSAQQGQMAMDALLTGAGTSFNLDVRPLILDERGMVDKNATEKNTKNDEVVLEAQNKNSANQKIIITNLSLDDINLDLSLERGKMFSKEFNGTPYPELPPVCDRTLSPRKSCYIDINFTSKVDGHFQDNLTIEYSGVHFKDKSGTKKIILKADRLTEKDEDNSDPNMSLKAWVPAGFLKRESFLDFGSLTEKEEKKERVRIKNNGKEHVGMLVRLRLGKNFAFTGGAYPGIEGTCKDILIKHKACWVEIEFIGNDPGLYNDDLLITYQDAAAKKTINLTVNILGERIKGE
ncbi:MAG: hypothetical protein ACOYL6_06975 [Bacteriovoracaceae bacterium]